MKLALERRMETVIQGLVFYESNHKLDIMKILNQKTFSAEEESANYSLDGQQLIINYQDGRTEIYHMLETSNHIVLESREGVDSLSGKWEYSMKSVEKSDDVSSNKQDDIILSEWISALDDKIPLRKMTIPGTHDSCTFGIHSSALIEDMSKCQTQPIHIQLEEGIRFLDLRVGMTHDSVQPEMWHDRISCHVSLVDVMNCCSKFLDKHPREFIILSLQKENHTSDCSLAIEVQKVLHRYSRVCGTEKMPTIGDLRGKILIIGGSNSASFVGLKDKNGICYLPFIDMQINQKTAHFTIYDITVYYQNQYNVPYSGFDSQTAYKKKIIDEFLANQTFEAETLDYIGWNIYDWKYKISALAWAVNSLMDRSSSFMGTCEHGIQLLDHYWVSLVSRLIKNNNFIK